jgi:hypothetical protein
MERTNHEDIVVALAEVRPIPRSEFAAELDQWAAAGFPPASKQSKSPLSVLARCLQNLAPRRLALAATASGLVAIAVATVVIAGSRPSSQPVALDATRPTPQHLFQFSESSPRHIKPAKGSSAAASNEKSSEIRRYSGTIPQQRGESQSSLSNFDGNAAYAPTHARLAHRDIERSAEIGLLADPTDVADDSAKIFAAVHDANGIVLHSTTSSGKGAGARFELLIPSARLGDALAAFSSIDEVRSRHEATDDITKPTVSSEEELQDVQARVDSLLAQLAGAEVESEREAIAAELHSERGQAARLRNQLARLHQRTAYSRVLVKIESGASTESGSTWGIGDAFHDAGHILGIAAGVTLVGLAVIAPLALLCLLAWLAQRLWLRTRRERALDT